ncbi:hypothetical protein D3C85_14420 [compost metagenome]
MRIEMSKPTESGYENIVVSHGDTNLSLLIGSYHSAAITDKANLFKEANEFIAQMLTEAEQLKMWEIYVKVSEYLGSDGIVGSYFVREEIEKLVRQIYSVVTYDRLRTYVDKAAFQIPTDVSEVFEEYNARGRSNYRNRTYIKADYMDLQAIALGLRFMVPIWGVFIQNVSAEHGNGFKESEAVKMVEMAGMAEWPPYKRMLEYVEASIGKDTAAITMTTVMAGLSSEEVPRHLMAMAMVRKIAVGVISTSKETESLARSLFNYVNGTFQRMDGRFQSVTGIVMPKKTRISDKTDEDNSSVWDDYSQTTDITEGARQLIEVFTEKVETIVMRSREPVELSRVQQCIAVCSRHESRPILPFQKALIFWVIRSISPEARELMTKQIMLRLMGIAQAILSHCGYHELAILVSAEEFIHDDGTAFMPSETRNKITKQQAEILDQQYPYYRQETKRQDPGKRSNVAVIAIDKVVDEMSARAWKPHAPRDIVEKIPMLSQMGYMYISGDIKRQLAEMIIRVNNTMRG